MNTYVRTVTSTDNQTTVQAELHVASTTGFSSGSGDVLADVAGRADDLSLADIVILQEDDLEGITNILVIVDNISNLVDKVNDSLCHPVSWSSLSTEDRDAGNKLLPLLRGHGLDLKVAVDDTKDVQLLALVFVDTLDLDIEQSSGVHSNTIVLLDVFCKSDLVGILDITELFAELLVINKGLQLVKQCKILEELMSTKLGCDQSRELGVGLVKPSSWSDTIGNVGELVRSVDLDKVLENCGLDQVGVQFCDTIDLVGADQS